MKLHGNVSFNINRTMWYSGSWVHGGFKVILFLKKTGSTGYTNERTKLGRKYKAWQSGNVFEALDRIQEEKGAVWSTEILLISNKLVWRKTIRFPW